MASAFAMLLIIVAGCMNGSFATPSKHIKNWRFENIWLPFSLWTFLILPWITIFILAPSIFEIYAKTPPSLLGIMIGAGLFFGIGQVAFSRAIHMIGIGLAFMLNLGLGMGLGFLLPLLILHPGQISTPFGLITLTGTLIAMTGLFFSTYAGHLRDRKTADHSGAQTHKKGAYFLGITLALVGGLATAGQNFAFSMTVPMQKIAMDHGVAPWGDSIIMWPGFLSCGLIPYLIYMLYLLTKNRTFIKYLQPKTAKYFVYTFIMGFCWFGSLILYSKATQFIGHLGPIVGWPLFMVLIILTSCFWGWKHQEWKNATRKAKQKLWIGLSLLILAVMVFGYSSFI
jgi:L-rhamnose-H+ transport protein